MLSSVGKHWKGVILSTPQLWSCLDDDMSRSQLRLMLERSGSSPLELNFRCGNTELGRKVASISKRCRTLDVYGAHTDVLGHFTSTTPVLRNLSLRSWSGGPFSLGEGPPLRRLQLSSIFLPWDSTRLRGLLTLSICDLPEHGAPSIPQLMAMLASSPRLEHLILRQVQIMPGEKDELGAMELDFPTLVELWLEKIPNPLYSYILSRLSAPNCRSTVLQPLEQSELEPTRSYDHGTAEFVQRFKHSLTSSSSLVVVLNPRSYPNSNIRLLTDGRWRYHSSTSRADSSDAWRAGTRPDGFELQLDTQARPSPASFTTLIDEVRRIANVTCTGEDAMSLDMRLERMPIMHEHSLGFDMVRSLTLDGESGFENTIISLGKRRDDGTWPFPGLKELKLGKVFSLGVPFITRALEARWIKGRNAKDLNGSVLIELPGGRKGRVGKQQFWKLANQETDKAGKEEILMDPAADHVSDGED